MDKQEPFKINIRIGFEHTDSYGLVYFANYPKFAEKARTEFFRKKLGLSPMDIMKMGLGFPYIKVDARYHHPALLDDELTVFPILKRIGNTSIHMDFKIQRKIDDKLLCFIETVSVCVDKQRKKTKVPESFRKKLDKNLKSDNDI